CNIADDDTGNATVLLFGAITPPRFRWVASRRGYASCMRHSGAGSLNGPTACKVDAAVSARQAALDPIMYRYVTTHNRRKRIRRPFGNLEQYPLSVISGLVERTVVSTRAKVDPRSGPF